MNPSFPLFRQENGDSLHFLLVEGCMVPTVCIVVYHGLHSKDTFTRPPNCIGKN